MIMGGSQEQKFDHPTQKPVVLMQKSIANHTNAGELVYEPFCGSGTTLMAAEILGRRCLGVELDPKYVDVDVMRWQQFTGRQAVLADGDRAGMSFDEAAQAMPGIPEAMNQAVPEAVV
jgi:DNA modification methylase